MTSSFSARMLRPAMQVGVGQVKAEQEPSGTYGSVGEMRHTAVQWFRSFTCQPQSPSLATALPACFGKCKCMSPTSCCSWGSDGGGGLFWEQRSAEKPCPCPALVLQPAGIHTGSPGRQAEGDSQSNREGTCISTCVPVLMCSFYPVFLGPETGWF